ARREPLVHALFLEQGPQDDHGSAGVLEALRAVQLVGQRRGARDQGMRELEAQIRRGEIHGGSRQSVPPRGKLRYRSPRSGRMVTTVCPGPSRRAISIAPRTFAPDDTPTRRPSSRASRREAATACSVLTRTIVSTSSRWTISGMKPSASPW